MMLSYVFVRIQYVDPITSLKLWNWAAWDPNFVASLIMLHDVMGIVAFVFLMM